MVPKKCEMTFSLLGQEILLIRLLGDWDIGQELPSAGRVMRVLESKPKVNRVAFHTVGLKGWDSNLLTFLNAVIGQCSGKNVEVEKAGLPDGVQRLLALSAAVPEKEGARRKAVRVSILAQVGENAIDLAVRS